LQLVKKDFSGVGVDVLDRIPDMAHLQSEVWMTFLVAIDSAETRQLLCYVLLSLGIKGLPAASAAEARRELADHPDTEGAIIDIDNQSIAGLDLITELKNHPVTKDLIIVAHTVQTGQSTVAALAQAGVAGCLLKSADKTETFEKLKHILEHATGHKGNQRRHVRIVPPPEDLLRLHFRVSGFPGLLTGKIINLSMGGLGLETMTPGAGDVLKPGTFIERLQFSLQGLTLGPAGVVAVVQGKIVGIRFSALGADDSVSLARYIFDKVSS
jgi:CheY-like chemotaxis protein